MANIIDINDNCVIEIVLKEIVINKHNFVQLLIIQEADNILPHFSLDLEMFDTSILKELKNNNTIIEINFGKDLSTLVKRKFRIKNHRMRSKGNKFSIMISGILDVADYTNQLNIIAIEGTSDEVFTKELKTVKLDIQYKGQDKQNWIRHNLPEKEFVDRVMRNAFIAEDDLVLCSLNIDKTLRFISLKEKFKGTELFTFANESDNEGTDVRYSNLSVETDDSIWKYLVSEGIQQPVYDLQAGELGYITANNKSTKTGLINDEITDNRNAPLLINNGNCFARYYHAYASNLSNKVNLFSYSIWLDISQRFFKETELSLLDLISIIPPKHNGEIDDTLKGKYIITAKNILLTQKGFVQKVRLNRDYML